MPEWTETNPLRVVTGYHNVARKFFTEKGFEHVVLLSADGALEAAPLMGTADIILDLVSPSTCVCAVTLATYCRLTTESAIGMAAWHEVLLSLMAPLMLYLSVASGGAVSFQRHPWVALGIVHQSSWALCNNQAGVIVPS